MKSHVTHPAPNGVPFLHPPHAPNRYEKLLQESPDVLCALDGEGRFLTIGGASRTLLGYEPSELEGRMFLELVEEADRDDTIQAVAAVKGGVSTTFKNRCYCKEEGVKSVFWSARWDEGEGVMYLVGRDAAEKITETERHLEERRLWDERLRQANEALQSVLESMSDGFYTVDRNWTITFGNTRMANMLGVVKADYIGKNLWTSFPALVGTKFYKEYHRAFEEDIFVSFEDYFPPLDMWLEANVYPRGNEISIYIKDITGRKRQERELRTSNERFQLVGQATSDVIWDWDMQTDRFYVSESFASTFGFEFVDPGSISQLWRASVHPGDLERMMDMYHAALENPQVSVWKDQYRIIKMDGKVAYVSDRAVILRNQEGRPVRLTGAVRDITAQKEAERALVESERSYRQLFDNAPYATVIFHLETGHILDANTELLRQYGYSREELLEKTIWEFHPPSEYDKVDRAKQSLKPDTRLNVGRVVHVKKDGTEILVEVTATLTDYRGLPAMLATAKDVTEQVHLQQQVLQQKIEYQKGITQAAIEAQEMERSEIGRELHDNVNQLLTTAKLYVENIAYYPAQSSLFIERGVGVLQNAITEIRRLSRALVTPTIRDVGFLATLEELVESYRSLHVFEVSTLLQFNEGALDKGVKLTLYRILQEAFNNTVKYARASHVQLNICSTRNTLKVVYSDDGVGFDPASVKEGLGLSNMKTRAIAYRGQMEIHSIEGGGCQIEIVFPLQAEVAGS